MSFKLITESFTPKSLYEISLNFMCFNMLAKNKYKFKCIDFPGNISKDLKKREKESNDWCQMFMCSCGRRYCINKIFKNMIRCNNNQCSCNKNIEIHMASENLLTATENVFLGIPNNTLLINFKLLIHSMLISSFSVNDFGKCYMCKLMYSKYYVYIGVQDVVVDILDDTSMFYFICFICKINKPAYLKLPNNKCRNIYFKPHYIKLSYELKPFENYKVICKTHTCEEIILSCDNVHIDAKVVDFVVFMLFNCSKILKVNGERKKFIDSILMLNTINVKIKIDNDEYRSSITFEELLFYMKGKTNVEIFIYF